MTTMSRFYFHVRTGANINIDEEGSECADISAARDEGLACMRELLVEAIRSCRADAPECLVIADADGLELATIAIKEVLPLQLQ